MRVREASGRVARYFRDVRTELKKILWPNRKQTVLYTAVVVVSVVIVAAVLWIMDAGFSSVLRVLIK